MLNFEANKRLFRLKHLYFLKFETFGKICLKHNLKRRKIVFYAVLAEVVCIAKLTIANKYILLKYNCAGKFFW